MHLSAAIYKVTNAVHEVAHAVLHFNIAMFLIAYAVLHFNIAMFLFNISVLPTALALHPSVYIRGATLSRTPNINRSRTPNKDRITSQ